MGFTVKWPKTVTRACWTWDDYSQIGATCFVRYLLGIPIDRVPTSK